MRPASRKFQGGCKWRSDGRRPNDLAGERRRSDGRARMTRWPLTTVYSIPSRRHHEPPSAAGQVMRICARRAELTVLGSKIATSACQTLLQLAALLDAEEVRRLRREPLDRELQRERLALAHPDARADRCVARVAQHIDMRAAVRQPDHRARIGDELLDAVLVNCSIVYWILRSSSSAEVDEGIERIGAAHLRDFLHGLAFERFDRRIGDFENLDAMPLAGEQMGPLEALAELPPEFVIAIDFLLLLGAAD